MVTRRALIALLVAAAALAAAPGSAWAHAALEGTVPASGSVLKTQPAQIEFDYSEAVEGNFGAVKVYDRRGKEVQDGDAFHPNDTSSHIAVKLKPGLDQGTYTATYRVISADGHPVSGGLVFSVGKASKSAGSVADLLSKRSNTGPPTEIGFGAVKALQDIAIALAVGGLAFLFIVWLPALAGVAGGDSRWAAASEAFVTRLRKVLLGAAVLGAITGLLGLVFQGATAAGVSFWSALDGDIVRDVVDTRWGTVWLIRSLVWLGLAGALLLTFQGARRPVLRSASVGATGLALPGRGRMSWWLLAPFVAFIVISPALAGHPSLVKPVWINFPANALHVAFMSLWVGGLAMLLFVLPAATRLLDPPDRGRLLASSLARFSTLAGISVAVILVTGIVQSLIEVRTFGHLLDTAFGRAVLIKLLLLLLLLVPLGAYNRQVSVPRLKRIAEGGESPGRAGLLLRRALRAEVLVLLAVFGVTAALTSYGPAYGGSGTGSKGPVSITKTIGPAQAQLTVDPARVGPNAMHLYLTDSQTGQPWDKTVELTVSASLPSKNVGALKFDARKAGPGHYVMSGAVFGVPGDWQVQLTSRVSDFDEYTTTAKVPIK
jgi:copper transport protein